MKQLYTALYQIEHKIGNNLLTIEVEVPFDDPIEITDVSWNGVAILPLVDAFDLWDKIDAIIEEHRDIAPIKDEMFQEAE